MKLYTPGPDADIQIAQWWLRMRDDGDLDKTFLASAHCLSGFMDIWKNTDLMVEIDDSGIYVAMWCQRFMGAGMLGLWVRTDKRHSVGAVRSVLRMYRAVFDSGTGSIVGITKQPQLLEEHERLGYRVLGEVPGLWDAQNSGFVVVLTADDFYAKWGRDDANSTDITGLSLAPHAAGVTVH